ncbi:MAG: hypothetical protein JW993_16510 [Sedimentisphaerales bacterium]|nr:hypothetical protein [Sedimentisphaerales bacterium]
MNDVPDANSVTLRSRKPLAPPFHRHIARGKLVGRTCRTGDRVVIYDIVATVPDEEVRVTGATQLQFE